MLSPTLLLLLALLSRRGLPFSQSVRPPSSIVHLRASTTSPSAPASSSSSSLSSASAASTTAASYVDTPSQSLSATTATATSTKRGKALDYETLLDMCEISNLCDVSPSELKRALANSSHIRRDNIRVTQRDLLEPGIKYNFLEYELASYDGGEMKSMKRRRVISIRGTKNVKNMQANMDRELVWRDSLQLKAHRGYLLLQDAIFDDFYVRKCDDNLLLSDRPVDAADADSGDEGLILTGHSMGGSVGVLLAVALANAGVNVSQVVTFGTPKFTNAAGASLLSGLPIVQIEHQKDPITLEPPVSLPSNLPFVDVFVGLKNRLLLLVPEEKLFGTAIKLSAHSCILDDDARKEKQASARKLPAQLPDLKYHSMNSYQEILAALYGADRWQKGVGGNYR